MLERRRRALAGDGTATVLIVGADLVVSGAAGPSPRAATDAGDLIGTPLADLFQGREDRDRIERAARAALRGSEGRLSVSTIGDGPMSAHLMPLHAGNGSAPTVVVTIEPERPIENELDELRTRASDLETLSRAARALARTNHVDEVGGIVCEAASDVAAADMAIMFEPDSSNGHLKVSAAQGIEVADRPLGIDSAAHAAVAFRENRHIYEGDLTKSDPSTAWPLHEAGAAAAVWQPVRRELAVRAVIGVGWCRASQRHTERLKASLELLAGEAAVAIDRAAALERLTVLARTDPLTDLSNRRAWEDELARELARAGRAGQRLCVGLLDLDELKAFNDRWGHAAGDRLLLTAAARWRRRLRLSDLLARIGGDEFAVTLPGCEIGEAVRLADQLRGALPDGLTCSIGVAEWTPGEPVDQLLERADRALYAAKGGGRNRTVPAPPAGAPAPS